MKLYELEELVFRRSARFALEIDQFSLEQGEKVAVVGPNGSGKTTLLRILSFLERADSFATFLYRGQPVAAGKMDRKELGFLKQQPLLFRGSVARNLAYPLKLRRLPSPEIEQRVGEMLALMELEPLADSRARDLSGGEQRRLALGRVLIGGQKTLLLDEPIAHLDERSRTVIEDVLVRSERTVLLTTHDVHFAHRVAGRVASLRGGRMTAGLSVNILEGQVQEGCLVTGRGLSVALPEGVGMPEDGSLTVTLDPRALVVTREWPVADAPNLLKGRISSIREQGDDVWLEVDCGDRLTAIVARARYEEEGLNLGSQVVVTFGPDAVEV